MNEERYGYIYITENLINGKRYIGQHKSSEFDKHYYGSGKLLKRAISLHGLENFKVSVVKWAFSKEELNDLEEFTIDYFNAVEDDNFYNLTKGGTGGCVWENSENREEVLKKLSIAQSKRQSENNSFLGKKHTEESKRKISEAVAGEKNPFYGKKHSEETRKKMSKTVIAENENEKIIFNSIQESLKFFNTTATTLNRKAKGLRVKNEKLNEYNIIIQERGNM